MVLSRSEAVGRHDTQAGFPSALLSAVNTNIVGPAVQSLHTQLLYLDSGKV